METLSVGEFKANFSEVIKKVQSGKEIRITYGRKKKVVARIIPELSIKERRKIGSLDGKAKVTFGKDFKITEEEFLSL